MAKIYTVREVNSFIKNMFDTEVLMQRISVTGEASNVKYHSSGHLYFSLKDSSGTISAVMFAGKVRTLKTRIADGQNLIVNGHISVYEPAGSYQVYVDSIQTEGSGELYERFEALKKELQEMGMFDASYKQAIPTYAKRIGVVTAETGAAIQDIIRVAHTRNPFVQLVLYPAQVQGTGAAEAISKGIQYLDEYGDVDVIIVGRGGGSIEDLWAFNEKIVAYAIFNCKTPIISAVGHEVDYTIADFVADRRAATPSAAAEMAVFEWKILMERLASVKQRLNMHMLSRLSHTKKELMLYGKRFLPLLDGKVESRKQRMDYYTKRLRAASPQNRLDRDRQKLIDKEDRLSHLMRNKLQNMHHQFELRLTGLEALSPLKKLQSGFSYVSGIKDGISKNIRSVKDVCVEDAIKIYVTDGSLQAKVTGIESEN